MPVIQREENGLHMYCGTLMRPPDPAERKYAWIPLKALPSAPKIEIGAGIFPFCGEGYDDRPMQTETGQGPLGSCAAWAMRHAGYAAGRRAYRLGKRDTSVQLWHPGKLYEDARKLHTGWFPNDTGSFAADHCDLCINGGPLEAGTPYIADRTYQYPQSLWDNKQQRDYIKAHHAFYPTEGDMFMQIAAALQQGYGIMSASYWPEPWFNPTQGRLPEGVHFNPNDGGHETFIWGINQDGVFFMNSWSRYWAQDAPASGLPFMRPGDFFVPRSYFQWDAAQSNFFEFRVINDEPVTPLPDPDPEPEPVTDKLQLVYAAAQHEIDALNVDAINNPRSTSRHYRAQGGQRLFDAVMRV